MDSDVDALMLERFAIALNRHCEERSDEAIQEIVGQRQWLLVASLTLAVTVDSIRSESALNFADRPDFHHFDR